jgi:hypothetical protein
MFNWSLITQFNRGVKFKKCTSINLKKYFFKCMNSSSDVLSLQTLNEKLIFYRLAC